MIKNILSRPAALAVETYRRAGGLSDTAAELNLSWTVDEREFLAADVMDVLGQVWREELAASLPSLRTYLVQDPLGEHLIGSAVKGFFRLPDETCVFTGAGVGSLLHAFAGIAHQYEVFILGEVYPDFPFWLDRTGQRPSMDLRACSVSNFIAARPPKSVAFLEHPSLSGELTKAQIALLCASAESAGSLVLIDESNANYLPSEDSAAPLVEQFDNLIVLRGFSKAYGLGALRLAFGVASSRLRPLIENLIPPLLATPLSLNMGERLLRLGDLARPLRSRVAEARTEAETYLASYLSQRPRMAAHGLPYLLVDGPIDEISGALAERGIRGKAHARWSVDRGGMNYIYRLSAPLALDRMAELERRLRP